MADLISGLSSASVQGTVAAFAKQLNVLGCRFTLIYTDAAVNGAVGVRMSSNVPASDIASLLGSLLEPGEKVRQMLADLFKAHPLKAALPPAEDADPSATPVLVDVPTEQAVELLLDALLTNLQLKGQQRASPIIRLG